MSIRIPFLQKSGHVEVSEAVFDQTFNEPLVHQVVTAYLAGGRAGTKAQKSRAEARGGGRKPWRQKGTGRARAGSLRSPLFRGGGRAFAADPRNFEQKVNRKMYRAAMRAILSELHRRECLVAVAEVPLDAPKTAQLFEWFKKIGGANGMLVLPEAKPDLMLAARNLPNVETCLVGSVDPVSLLRRERVIMVGDALEQLDRRLQ